MTPDRARDFSSSDVGVLDDVGEQEMRFDRGSREAPEVRVTAEDLDPSENLLSGLPAEFWQTGQLPILRHALQVIQRLDAERVVNELHLDGAEPGNAQELQQPLGDSLAQPIEIRRLARLDQLANDRQRRRSDPLNLRQLAGPHERAKIVGIEGDQGARRSRVRARLEFLFAFDFEEGADLGENVRGRAGIHAPNI